MKLIPEWKRTLAKAWSVRLAVFAAVLEAAQEFFPVLDALLTERPRIQIAYSLFKFLVIMGAILARIVAQPRSLPDETR